MSIFHLEVVSRLLVEGVQELEGSPHLVGGHQELVVQVGLAEEEADDGDLGSVQVVGDAQVVALLLGRGLGLGLHVGDDVFALAGAVVLVHAALPEELEGGPGADVVLEHVMAFLVRIEP